MFFTETEISEKFAVRRDTLKPDCTKCGLYKDCISPYMGWTGAGNKKILIIGTAPGANEDQQNTHLVGNSGIFLRNELRKKGINVDVDCWKTNAVNCRPPKSRIPTKTEIKCCKPFVDQIIAKLKPEHIWLFGPDAIRSFMGDKFNRLSALLWRGLHIPDKGTKAWVHSMYSPSYVLQNDYDKNTTSVFNRDLAEAVIKLSKEPYIHENYNKKVRILYDYQEVVNQLDYVLKTKPKYLYIDYETTGLKPYMTGHKIATISFCYSEKISYAFPFNWKHYWTQQEYINIKLLWRKILKDKDIKKLAHNIKFEHIWGKIITGVATTPWEWDTMLAAHILDNRRGYVGLKFQTYINFGIPPYDNEIGSYLKGDGGFNNIEDAPLPELLLYNGLDTLFGMMLFLKQCKNFNYYDQLALFHEGVLNFADMEMNGISVKEEFYFNKNSELECKIAKLREGLEDGEDARTFEEKQNKKLDIGSNKDLGILIYELCGIEPIYTDKGLIEIEKGNKGNYRVNAETLETIELPFIKDLLAYRKAEKLRGTFLAQFIRETCNGQINPHFNLHTTVSFRSSSDSPNFQNVPKREEEAKKVTRGGLIPSLGNQLLEIDFSGVEVSVAACITKDPELSRYVTDDSTDMHLDTAMDLWLLPKKEITKDIRFCSKGGWVFAQFYGSYYANCAQDLWKERHLLTKSGIPLIDNLNSNGIYEYEQFEEHCQIYENKFWHERFVVYNDWKTKVNNEYQKYGYITSPFGFRFSGQMSKKQVNNYPIQSGAFHILLWCLNKISKIVKEKGFKSKIIGQIHDSIIFDAVPNELDSLLQICDDICTQDTVEEFKWILVPLEIDAEISKINGNFAEMEEIKVKRN